MCIWAHYDKIKSILYWKSENLDTSLIQLLAIHLNSMNLVFSTGKKIMMTASLTVTVGLKQDKYVELF